MPSMRLTILHLITFFSFFTSSFAQTAYANDFVDPDYILAKTYGNHTYLARTTAVSWAKTLAAKGPWSVINKAATPPSGDKHDFMSWAPYWWPDCSNAGNTTALTPEQIWVTCTYVNKDGQFNPDVRLVNNVGDFQDFAEASFYNAIAWAMDVDDKATFEANVVKFISAWFLDPATAMNPNLNFAQMQRGPTGQVGSRTGVLDLKAMAKVASAVLLLRKGKSTAWTADIDNQFIEWSRKYITWLENSDLAIKERESKNNHGSFYYNQLAAMKLIVNDAAGAKAATDDYFKGIYLDQISATGEQPLEAARTRPYHYRAYNLAAMITNARLAKYADPSSTVWNTTTTAGATIKTALDFAMTLPASTSGETSYTEELYPDVAAVASVYGDPDGKYLAFLKKGDPKFIAQPYIVWNQPFAEQETGGLPPTNTGKGNSGPSTPKPKSGSNSSADATSDAISHVSSSWIITFITCALALAVGISGNF
uniref:Alginate lyase domain-containing protein n=1 Tax=Psilocybe cubensis TaxID=181762 RepID=A0A8H7XTG2_PSICU